MKDMKIPGIKQYPVRLEINGDFASGRASGHFFCRRAVLFFLC